MVEKEIKVHNFGRCFVEKLQLRPEDGGSVTASSREKPPSPEAVRLEMDMVWKKRLLSASAENIAYKS